MHDLNAEMDKRHEERAKEFGERPFIFGKIDGEPAVFYLRPVVGYMGVRRISELSDASSAAETYDAVEQVVISMLDPRDDAAGRLRQVLVNNDYPITFEDLVALQNWLLTEHTALPPTEPQPSVDSSTDSGPSSTEPSSTEPGEASTS